MLQHVREATRQYEEAKDNPHVDPERKAQLKAEAAKLQDVFLIMTLARWCGRDTCRPSE